eukprot:8355665-Pyramimonas_sp.AAC.3
MRTAPPSNPVSASLDGRAETLSIVLRMIAWLGGARRVARRRGTGSCASSRSPPMPILRGTRCMVAPRCAPAEAAVVAWAGVPACRRCPGMLRVGGVTALGALGLRAP